jgi:hypothetical protein
MSDTEPGWYAVRCLFRLGKIAGATGSAYEERVTLWRADSSTHAIQRAEHEAVAYARTIEESPDEYVGLAQCYRLADEPGDGVEVFSLIRTSELEPDDYIDSFFDTGTERQGHLSE